MSTHLRLAAAASAVILIATACSGGDDSTSTTDDSAAPSSEQATAPDSGPPGAEAEDDAVSSADPADRATDPSGIRIVPDEVDPSAEQRCERYGYPCGWAASTDEAWDRSLELLEESSAMLAGGTGPLSERLSAAALMLMAESDVVEVDPQIETLAGITFRVDGAPEVIVLTEAAWPGGADAATTLGDDDLFIEPDVLADQLGVEPAVFPETETTPPADGESVDTEPTPPDTEAVHPLGFGAGAQLRAFDPTKGPLVTPRQALVIDPYHAVDAQWREGDEVAALFESHPDYAVVRHLKDSVSHADLTSFSLYDAVHVVSHGYTRCPRNSEGEIIPDGSRCSSGFGLGVVPSGFDRSSLPAGVTVLNSSVDGNNRQFAFDSFFAGQGLEQNLGETVVMFSTCQSSGLGSGYSSSQGTLLDDDLQTPMMGIFGSALGWDQNVTLRAGANASLAFWSLTVEEGVDAELAYEQLQQVGLDVSGERNDLLDDFVDYIQENPPNAELRYAGDDLRVRDVIETRYQGSELVPETKVKLATTPGDGADDTIDQLQFFVEAVRDDELAATEIKLFLDDAELPETINLSGNGRRIGGGNGYGHYLVTVENVNLGLDIPRSDVDPANLKDYRLEARVSSDGFTDYSAHEADPIHFGAEFIARGPIPIMNELADGMPAGGALEGNELAVTFDTVDPQVDGEYLAVMTAQGIEVGYWALTLEGTYDFASGEMSGTISGDAFGGIGGITAGDSGSGTWEGRVDFSSGTLRATLGIGGSSQQYDGTF